MRSHSKTSFFAQKVINSKAPMKIRSSHLLRDLTNIIAFGLTVPLLAQSGFFDPSFQSPKSTNVSVLIPAQNDKLLLGCKWTGTANPSSLQKLHLDGSHASSFDCPSDHSISSLGELSNRTIVFSGSLRSDTPEELKLGGTSTGLLNESGQVLKNLNRGYSTSIYRHWNGTTNFLGSGIHLHSYDSDWEEGFAYSMIAVLMR